MSTTYAPRMLDDYNRRFEAKSYAAVVGAQPRMRDGVIHVENVRQRIQLKAVLRAVPGSISIIPDAPVAAYEGDF